MQEASSTDNLNETATYYLLALRMGLFTVDEVVAWCGEVIATHSDPPPAILRASALRGKESSEVEKELAQLEGEVDIQAINRQIFVRSLKLLEEEPGRLFELIRKLDNSHLQIEEFVGSDLPREIEYFSLSTYLAEDANIAAGHQEELAATIAHEFADFLHKGIEGETTNYAQQASFPIQAPATPLRKKLPGLVFEALVVGWLTAIAILLLRSQGQSGGGIGWGEVFLVLIIVALYFGINRWRKKK